MNSVHYLYKIIGRFKKSDKENFLDII